MSYCLVPFLVTFLNLPLALYSVAFPKSGQKLPFSINPSLYRLCRASKFHGKLHHWMFFFSPMCLCIHVTVYAGDLLKCKCSRPLCDQSYCHTNFKCYKSISVHSNEEEEVMFGCYEKGGPADRFNACNNGTLDIPTHKIRCCNDNDMCNEDLDVTLGGSPTTPPVTQSPSPTGMLYFVPL